MIPIPPIVTAYAARIGLTGAIIAGLCALLAVQTVRIEGLSIWPVKVEGWKPRAIRLQGDIDAVRTAQAEAAQKALEARLAAEQAYRDKAKEADRNEAETRNAALDAADRYIAANRVRCPTPASSSGGTVAAAQGGSAEGVIGSGAGAVMDDRVAVTADDIRICTANTTRLIAARDWALGLGE